jgi:hypothetical protein
MNKYLQGNSGTFSDQEIPVEDEVIMGRDASICQLVFPASESGISGVHCKLQNIDGTCWQLTDMGSTNGTFLDSGVRLAPYEPQQLSDGQRFYLGDRENTFTVGVEGAVSYTSEDVDVIQQDNSKKSFSGIGISIAALVLGILAVISGIASIFYDLALYIAFVFAIIGTGLGAVSLAIHFKGKYMALSGTVCSAIVVLALVGGLIHNALTPKTLVGSWESSEINEVTGALASALESALTEAGMDSRIASWIVDTSGIGDELTFTFSENGNFYISDENGLNIGIDLFTWENVEGECVFTLDLSDVQIMGVSLPIKIRYSSEYEIKGDKLTMDFFGQDIVLKRK